MKIPLKYLYHKPIYLCAVLLITLIVSGIVYQCNLFMWLINQLYIVPSKLEPADVILVDDLGGELNEAIRLYQAGIVQRFLITANLPERYKNESLPLSKHQFILQKLKDTGIPSDAIAVLPREATNRLDQQRLIRDWFYKHQISSYIIQPLLYQTRLEQTIHRDTFPNGHIKLVMHPTEGNVLFRKALIGYQNVFIYWLYWKLYYAPQITNEHSNPQALLPPRTAYQGQSIVSLKFDQTQTP